MRILGERLTPFLRYPAFEFSCKRKVFYLQNVVHNDLILPFEYSGWLGFERFVQLVAKLFNKLKPPFLFYIRIFYVVNFAQEHSLLPNPK